VTRFVPVRRRTGRVRAWARLVLWAVGVAATAVVWLRQPGTRVGDLPMVVVAYGVLFGAALATGRGVGSTER
jgi:hypothetical protein